MQLDIAPNTEVINLLDRLAQIADLRGDDKRAAAYKGAILGIRKLNYPVTDKARLKSEKIAGVGAGILKKLIEYADTGQIAELVRLEQSEEIIAYKTLSKIAGAGPRTVAEWIHQKILDIPSLRAAVATDKVKLTAVQKYGLMYYVDLGKRIPRADVAQIGAVIIGKIRQMDQGATCEIVGSYRRGAADSGDIDIITCGNFQLKELEKIIGDGDPNFVATFSSGAERLTFIYHWNGVVRQVDVLKLGREQYWSGILYFTGSWEFNTAMRGYAKAKGLLLNQRGLFRKNVLLPVNSEEEVFAAIGLRYIPPAERLGPNQIIPL